MAAGHLPKQYLPLAGRTVIEWSLAPFLRHSWVEQVVVVLAAGDAHWERLAIAAEPKLLIATGGRSRADSVRSGLAALASRAAADDWILVHDAARPCLHDDDLQGLVRGLEGEAIGGLLAARITDTLKQVGSAQRVEATLQRDKIWRALTPQMFRYDVLRRALTTDSDVSFTDEAASVEALGLAPVLIEGRADNVKITYPQDLALAEFVRSQVLPPVPGMS